MEQNGIIYKITNLVNGKIYIGKTKEYRGEIKFGIEGRFKHHKASALKDDKTGSPLLKNAMKKYGVDNFKIEKLLNCSLEEVDEKEIEMIKQHDSTNRNIGYNIALGGKGRSVVHVPEDARARISESLRKNNSIKKKSHDSDDSNDEIEFGDNSDCYSEMNIQPVHRDDKLVGYKVRRREHKAYTKWFTSTKYTPEENLKLAQEWLADFKGGDIRLNTKETPLPENVCYAKNKKGEIVGYIVDVMKNNVKFRRTFSLPDKTMEQKLEQAIAYKNSVLNDCITDKPNINMKNPDLPRNVNIYKNKSGEIIGYCGKVIVNGKMQKKLFIKVDVPMEEKLKQATAYVNSILNIK